MRFHPFVVSSFLVWLSAAALPGAAGASDPQGEAGRSDARPEKQDGLAVALNDLWITAVAKARLLRSEEVPGMSIDVDARDGVVTLFGMVPSPSAQAAAELEVVKMDGVHRVENLLEIVPEPHQEATRTHDRALERVLRERLVAQPEIAEPELDVAVCNGIARLRGQVENADEHRVAVQIVRETDGVRDVVDQLQIDGEPASSEHAASY